MTVSSVSLRARVNMTHNELLNEHSLADTCTTEETNLATTSVGSQQVDDLDTGDQHLSAGGLLDELWRVGMDGQLLLVLDGSALVDGVARHVHDTAERAVADRNHDGLAGVGGLVSTDETLGTVHGNASHGVLTQMLLSHGLAHGPLFQYCHLVSLETYCDLEHQSVAAIVGLNGVENGRQLLRVELDCCRQLARRICFPRGPARARPSRTVDDGANHLMDLAIPSRVGGCESLRDGGGEGLGLEGLAEGGFREGGGAERRPRNAAARVSIISMAALMDSIGVDVRLEHDGGDGGVFVMERRGRQCARRGLRAGEESELLGELWAWRSGLCAEPRDNTEPQRLLNTHLPHARSYFHLANAKGCIPEHHRHTHCRCLMRRISPRTIRAARALDPRLAKLLPVCRDLRSAQNELRWIGEHVRRDTQGDCFEDSVNVLHLVTRRAQGEPLQYILGTEFFGDLELKCREGVLIPR